MSKLLMACVAFMLTGLTFAADTVDCGYLNITILNRSGHTCLLNSAQVGGGRIVYGAPSHEIQNGEMSANFRMQQSYTQGPRIRLSYTCQNKTIVMTSQQNFCFLEAGNISGQVESTNNVFANFVATPGYYWYKIPGQIFWTIY